MSDPTQKHRFASIETPLGEDRLLLRSFNGREELGRIFDYHLTLLDTQQDLDPDDLVGSNVSVRLQAETDESKDTRYFNGFIASMAFAGNQDEGVLYHARMAPWLWLLTRTSDCRSFQNKTVQQILQEVFTDYGFKDFRFDLTGNYLPKVFCVQYNETAFNFVSRIMEHEGIYYWWEHENGKHTMVITDDMATHPEHPLRKEIEWRGSRGGLEGGYLYNLRAQKTLSPGGFSVNDYNFKMPKEDLRSHTVQRLNHAAASFEHFEYPNNYRDAGYGETLSKVRLQEAQVNHDTMDAQVTARAMASGYKFMLTRAERADQEKKYLIVSSSVSVTVNPYKTGSGGEDKFAGQITALPETAVFRPARVTPKPVMTGPQPALVVGPPGEEIYCDENGRVKVHFYWDRRSEANAESSKWVRVSQPSAGGQYGFMSVPRIGQEVLVEFMNGDPDQPIITGRVYNGEYQHPYDPQSLKSKSSWKTNTYPGGGGFNELRFEDAKGKEQIFLHGQKDMDTRILDESREFVGVNKHVIIGKDSREKVGQDKHETIVRDSIERVDRDQFKSVLGKDLRMVGESFEVQTGKNVRFAAVGETRIYSKGDLGIESVANVVIESASSVTLRCGNNFVTVNADGVTIQGTNVYINSDKPLPSRLAYMKADPIKQPTPPEPAADAPAGRVETSKGMGYQLKSDSYSSQKVSSFDLASGQGSPFHELASPEEGTAPTLTPEGGSSALASNEPSGGSGEETA